MNSGQEVPPFQAVWLNFGPGESRYVGLRPGINGKVLGPAAIVAVRVGGLRLADRMVRLPMLVSGAKGSLRIRN